MNRQDFIKIVNEKIKLIRIEKNYTQDKMADMIGISKKTLVQVEKGRASLSWPVAIAVCVIFKDSELIDLSFGGDIENLIRSLSFENSEKKYVPTFGGKVWWNNIDEHNDYTIQQNIISNHYRILDGNKRRVSYSFDLDFIKKRFEELSR